MASYTIELRNVCEIYGRDEVENWFKSYNIEDYLTPKQIDVVNKNGLWSKEKLAFNIVEHYWMREIGLETPALFAHQAKVKMREIMERMLPRIYSNSIEFDPMVNVDFTESFERNIDGTSSGNSKSNSNSGASGMNINNNTPQGRVTKQEIDSGAYASSVNQSETNSNVEDETNTTGASNTVEKYTRKQKGNSGTLTTAQALIKQYREIIIDIDEEVISELDELFMGIY